MKLLEIFCRIGLHRWTKYSGNGEFPLYDGEYRRCSRCRKTQQYYGEHSINPTTRGFWDTPWWIDAMKMARDEEKRK